MQQWENFENRSTFGKDMDKICGLLFLGQPVVCSLLRSMGRLLFCSLWIRNSWWHVRDVLLRFRPARLCDSGLHAFARHCVDIFTQYFRYATSQQKNFHTVLTSASLLCTVNYVFACLWLSLSAEHRDIYLIAPLCIVYPFSYFLPANACIRPTWLFSVAHFIQGIAIGYRRWLCLIDRSGIYT